eukprot:gene595-785_t
MAFGFTSEDLRMILAPMAQSGMEAIGSMGTDVPLAVLSEQSQHMSSYFKQLFAQMKVEKHWNVPWREFADRAIDSDHAPIPTLLATAAIHHHLI